MRFIVNDEKYEIDPESLLVSELDWLERKSGLSPKEFYEGLGEMKPSAVRGLVWFAKKRAGDAMPAELDDLDFPLLEVMSSIETDVEPADPTNDAAVASP